MVFPGTCQIPWHPTLVQGWVFMVFLSSPDSRQLPEILPSFSALRPRVRSEVFGGLFELPRFQATSRDLVQFFGAQTQGPEPGLLWSFLGVRQPGRAANIFAKFRDPCRLGFPIGRRFRKICQLLGEFETANFEYLTNDADLARIVLCELASFVRCHKNYRLTMVIRMIIICNIIVIISSNKMARKAVKSAFP